MHLFDQSDSKDIYNVSKIYIFPNKCCPLELSVHHSIPKKEY